jgi:hypothetical protein
VRNFKQNCVTFWHVKMSEAIDRLRKEGKEAETRLLLDQLPFAPCQKFENDEVRCLRGDNRHLRMKIALMQLQYEEREMLLRYQLERQYLYTRGVEAYVDVEIGKVHENMKAAELVEKDMKKFHRKTLQKTAYIRRKRREMDFERMEYEDKIKELKGRIVSLEAERTAKQYEVMRWLRKTTQEFKEEVREKMKSFLNDLAEAENDCYVLANALYSCEHCSKKWR